MSIAPEPERKRGLGCVWDLAITAGVLLFLAMLAIPAIQNAREAGLRSSCVGDLKFVGLALNSYCDARRCFPPAYHADTEGKPMHSWRVLVLPFIEQGSLYKRYSFGEPWNAPANRALEEGAPLGMDDFYPMYHCPCDTSSPRFNISKAMIVGEEAFSPRPERPNGERNHGWNLTHHCRGRVGRVGNPLDGASRLPIQRDELQDRRSRPRQHPQARTPQSRMHCSATAASAA